MFTDPINTYETVIQRQAEQRRFAAAGRFPRVLSGCIERFPRRLASRRHTSSQITGQPTAPISGQDVAATDDVVRVA